MTPTSGRSHKDSQHLRSLRTVALSTAFILRAAVAFSATPITYTPDPVTPDGAVMIERVAARTAVDQPTWRMNLDLYAKNGAEVSLTLTRIVIQYPGTTIPAKDVILPPLITVSGYSTAKVVVPENRVLPFPLPATVQVTLFWTGYDAQTVTYPLFFYLDHTPTGGYRFPGLRRAAGQYWSIRNTQDLGAGHRNSRPQKFAYDLGVSRWNGTEWVETRDPKLDPDPNVLTNDDYLSYGQPIYAMAAGTIIECRSDVADNTPQPATNGIGGGNSFWIDHGNGEIALYAHLQAGSIPPGLCPTQSQAATANSPAVHAKPVTVTEGQFLGRAGNSGATGGHPHFHLHLQDRRPLDWIDDGGGAQALPLLFDHAQMHSAGTNDMTGYDPTDPSQPDWTDVQASEPAAIPSYALTYPNPCGWHPVTAGQPEVARNAVSDACLQEVFDDVTRVGFRPIWLDGYDMSGKPYFNLIFRPAGGIPTAAYAGMTGAQYQATFDSLTASGFRLLQVDSYLSNGEARYAAVFVEHAGAPWVAYHGVSHATHTSEAQTLLDAGFHPVNVSAISVGGVLQLTALWEQSDVGRVSASATIPAAQYQAFFDAAVANGLTQTYVDAYRYNGGVYFSAIFVEKAGASSWVSLAGLSNSDYKTAYAAQRAAGRLTVALTGYNDGGAQRFAGLWFGN
jgi:murein DD-endopeptidase MepM/ murein hydrolase activator NlpD